MEGEGCFDICNMKSKTHKIGYSVLARMSITQDSRDIVLMNSLLEYLKCGIIFSTGYLTKSFVRFAVTSTKDLNTQITPHFNKYPLQGPKLLDFVDWCKAVEIIKAKGHLTFEGLEQLQNIKKGMNTGRKS